MESATITFTHSVLGFSFDLPIGWKVTSWNQNTSNEAYSSFLQKSIEDLPAAGDFRHVLIVQQILADEFDRIRCSVELAVWKDEPFALPAKPKKLTCGELVFFGRVGKYGRGGQSTSGQLDLGDGLVLHITTSTDEPAATEDLKDFLATGRLVVEA
jgi:hypothetical protein